MIRVLMYFINALTTFFTMFFLSFLLLSLPKLLKALSLKSTSFLALQISAFCQGIGCYSCLTDGFSSELLTSGCSMRIVSSKQIVLLLRITLKDFFMELPMPIDAKFKTQLFFIIYELWGKIEQLDFKLHLFPRI